MQFKRDLNQNSKKINWDKYYTPDELSQYCIKKTFEILENENITEIIEPSAGNGSFSKKLNCLAYDLFPEDDSILREDFLKLSLNYKQGRLFIGNPPYGSRFNLGKSFVKKCFDEGDYVSFILPISQLNNNQSIYEFDLIYSENLGEIYFVNKKIRVCLNIYKRPVNGKNKKLNYKKKLIDIIEIREIREQIKNKNPKRKKILNNFDYDLAICAWGASGKVIEKESKYAKEFYIKIKNDKLKEELKTLLSNANWKTLYPMTAVPNILQWQVYKLVEDYLLEKYGKNWRNEFGIPS